MSNYSEFNDIIAFHPGYYVNELVESSGLSQKDFANRLGTTPKNLSILIRGGQSLSVDMATKLSRMYGTDISFWLNLQKSYDEKVSLLLSEYELNREREIFKLIDYGYFKKHFGLPSLAHKLDEQIKQTREYLAVSSLSVLEKMDLSVNFMDTSQKMNRARLVNTNIMVQIAVNETLNTDAPRFDKRKFENAVEKTLKLGYSDDLFLKVCEMFKRSGVVIVTIPNIKVAEIAGATKKVNGRVMLMVSDKGKRDTDFWMALFHEVCHILKGEFCASLMFAPEDEANAYAIEAMRKLQKSAEKNGISEMTLDEINEEISEYRKERKSKIMK